MALAKLTDIQKIARDCYRGNVEKFSKNAANDVLRAEIIERVGGEWNYTNFQKNKWDVYALLQEIIDVDLVHLSEEAFKQFCEVKNFELGDAPEFVVKNNNLFKVGIIADGINSTRRQRKLGNRVRTEAFKLAIATYEELDRFIAGRIDWKDYVDTVVASFNHEIATQIVGAFGKAYSEIGTNLKASTNAEGVDEELVDIIEDFGRKNTMALNSFNAKFLDVGSSGLKRFLKLLYYRSSNLPKFPNVALHSKPFFHTKECPFLQILFLMSLR